MCWATDTSVTQNEYLFSLLNQREFRVLFQIFGSMHFSQLSQADNYCRCWMSNRSEWLRGENTVIEGYSSSMEKSTALLQILSSLFRDATLMDPPSRHQIFQLQTAKSEVINLHICSSLFCMRWKYIYIFISLYTTMTTEYSCAGRVPSRRRWPAFSAKWMHWLTGAITSVKWPKCRFWQGQIGPLNFVLRIVRRVSVFQQRPSTVMLFRCAVLHFCALIILDPL